MVVCQTSTCSWSCLIMVLILDQTLWTARNRPLPGMDVRRRQNQNNHNVTIFAFSRWCTPPPETRIPPQALSKVQTVFADTLAVGARFPRRHILPEHGRACRRPRRTAGQLGRQ